MGKTLEMSLLLRRPETWIYIFVKVEFARKYVGKSATDRSQQKPGWRNGSALDFYTCQWHLKVVGSSPTSGANYAIFAFLQEDCLYPMQHFVEWSI